MLTPQWLRTFSAVAALKSFTKAADQLGLTQAAVSQHVAHLEDKLGPLLPRHARQAFPRPEAISVIAQGAPVVDSLWIIHRAECPLSNRAARVMAYLQTQMG